MKLLYLHGNATTTFMACKNVKEKSIWQTAVTESHFHKTMRLHPANIFTFLVQLQAATIAFLNFFLYKQLG